MNLHQVVSPAISAINPPQIVGIRQNVGPNINADGTQGSPKYATPGSITASIGGTFTGSIDSANPTTLIVAAVLSGSLQVGDAVSGSDGTNSLLPNTTIVDQLSGPPGGAGNYEISAAPATGELASCTVTSASTILNVTAIAGGVLRPGQTLADAGAVITPGTMITSQIFGTNGGVGLYELSDQQTVASEAITTSMSLIAQVQPLTGGALRRMDALNLQGSHRSIYFNADVKGIVRVGLKGGDLVILPDQSIWLINQLQEPWYSTAGLQHAVITLQKGS